MKPRRLSTVATLAVAASLAVLTGCSHLPFTRHQDDPKPAAVGKKPAGGGLALEIRSSPDPLKLGLARQLDVTVVIRNQKKEPVRLKFPNTQVIEILLRDPDSGKVVSQWSTDRTFTGEGRYILINPQERIEFNEPITTRELHAGKAYALEAFCVGYEKELHATKAIIPQP